MQLTIPLPEDLSRRLQTLPDLQTFVAQVVARVLDRRGSPESESPPHSRSRWSRLVERVETDPDHLDGYGVQLKRDMREFRENFCD